VNSVGHKRTNDEHLRDSRGTHTYLLPKMRDATVQPGNPPPPSEPGSPGSIPPGGAGGGAMSQLAGLLGHCTRNSSEQQSLSKASQVLGEIKLHVKHVLPPSQYLCTSGGGILTRRPMRTGQMISQAASTQLNNQYLCPSKQTDWYSFTLQSLCAKHRSCAATPWDPTASTHKSVANHDAPPVHLLPVTPMICCCRGGG
jgi:hypothetical protein